MTTMSYPDRLTYLGLHSLNIAECILISGSALNSENPFRSGASAFFSINVSLYCTRGNSVQLNPLSLSRHNFRSKFFPNTVIHVWNSPPLTVVTATSKKIFRSRLENVNLFIFCKCYPF